METLVHLFWSCPFADLCWDIVCPTRDRSLSLFEAFEDLKLKLQVPFFIEIIILASWGIWMVRNNKIFRNILESLDGWKAIYYSELSWLKFRIKQKYADHFKRWLEAHVIFL